MSHINRVNNAGRRFDGRHIDDQQPDHVKNKFREAISTYDSAPQHPGHFHKETSSSVELLPNLKYYQQHLGFDQETYELYKQMIGRTLEFSAAYLEAEMNPPDGYKPFFA